MPHTFGFLQAWCSASISTRGCSNGMRRPWWRHAQHDRRSTLSRTTASWPCYCCTTFLGFRSPSRASLIKLQQVLVVHFFSGTRSVWFNRIGTSRSPWWSCNPPSTHTLAVNSISPLWLSFNVVGQLYHLPPRHWLMSMYSLSYLWFKSSHKIPHILLFCQFRNLRRDKFEGLDVLLYSPWMVQNLQRFKWVVIMSSPIP